MKAVSPEPVVITTGMHEGHKHPRCSVVENLGATALKQLRHTSLVTTANDLRKVGVRLDLAKMIRAA